MTSIEIMILILDHDTKSYCNTVFSHDLIPITKKSARVINHNATIIDYILQILMIAK